MDLLTYYIVSRAGDPLHGCDPFCFRLQVFTSLSIYTALVPSIRIRFIALHAKATLSATSTAPQRASILVAARYMRGEVSTTLACGSLLIDSWS